MFSKMHCKKKLLAASLLLSLSVLTITGCGSKSKETASPGEKIVLNEVAHSIFYAPMYVAVEEGYFNEEGIDLDGLDRDAIATAPEVFEVGDGRYLIVES